MTLSAQIEAILFVETKPVTFQRLAKLLNVTVDEVTTAIQQLAQDYITAERGINVVVTTSQVQLVTAPAAHDLVSQLSKDERTGELTRPALETLAIIAYRSPVTKAEIEMIRGINCSLILRNLMIRGLVEERFDETKGAPIYDITPEYLQLLGVSSVQALPDYDTLNRDITLGEHLAVMEQPGDFFKGQLADASNTTPNDTAS